jgi:hypothetical protein
VRLGDRQPERHGGHPDPGRQLPVGLALSPDGTPLYTGGSVSGSVTTLDTINRTVVLPTITRTIYLYHVLAWAPLRLVVLGSGHAKKTR